MIDARAVIDPTATLGADIDLGPWSVLGPGVILEQGCRIAPHVSIRESAHVGAGSELCEFVTVFDGAAVGDRVLVMPGAHLGPQCRIGDDATIGAQAVVGPGVRVGTCSAVAALSALCRDVPGYVEMRGNPAEPVGIASEALARRGVPGAVQAALERAYLAIYREAGSIERRTDLGDLLGYAEVRELVDDVARMDT